MNFYTISSNDGTTIINLDNVISIYTNIDFQICFEVFGYYHSFSCLSDKQVDEIKRYTKNGREGNLFRGMLTQEVGRIIDNNSSFINITTAGEKFYEKFKSLINS